MKVSVKEAIQLFNDLIGGEKLVLWDILGLSPVFRFTSIL